MTELEVIPLRAEDVHPLRSPTNELYRSAIGNEVDVQFINLLLEDTFGDSRLNATSLERERIWVAKDGGEDCRFCADSPHRQDSVRAQWVDCQSGISGAWCRKTFV